LELFFVLNFGMIATDSLILKGIINLADLIVLVVIAPDSYRIMQYNGASLRGTKQS